MTTKEVQMLTAQQHHILRHALGLTRSTSEYRNHYVTGPGSQDYADCEALVAAGLMWRRDGNELTGGDPVYIVTEDGIAVAREPWGGPDGHQ